MSYQDAEAYLEALGVDSMKSRRPSMHRIEALCEALGHPERNVAAIHVTGTNGKTSTTRIAAALLEATGLKVGAYTSPHLQTVRERLAMGKEPLSEDAFGEVFDHIHPYLENVERRLGDKISYFEVLTAMFLLWASDHVDAAVIEVGLGGKWDATNVVSAPVAVITNVSLDHTAILGPDRETIAREKVGIIKPESVVVTAERHPAVLEIISKQAGEVKASTSVVEKDFFVKDNRIAFGGRYLSIATSQADYDSLFLPLHGSHQGLNAATALEAVVSFLPARKLDHEVVVQGMAAAEVPGRLELFRPAGVEFPVVLDVAHNPEGMSALVSSLAEGFAFERVHFVVGTLKAKDYSGILNEMARLPCSLVLTQSRSMESVPLEELGKVARSLQLPYEAHEDVASAVNFALGSAGTGDLVCVTGSHYVVGEARAHLMSTASREV